MRNAFFILTTLFAFHYTHSQVLDLKFDHLDDVRALNYRSVNDIAQDAQGFIWFGSQDGLLRYDGYGVKIFKNVIGDKNSLSDNNIRALTTDSLGNIWIATQGGGLSQYITTEERFITYKHNPDDETSISGDAVWSLYLDSKGFLWVGTWSDGLNKFDPTTETFKRIASSNDPVLAIYEDEDGIIWYTSNGLSYINPKDGSKGNYSSNPNDSTGLSSNSIRAINGMEDGKIWIGTDNGGLNIFDKSNKSFTHYSTTGLTENTTAGIGIYDILIDGNQAWLATNNGLDVLDIETQRFFHFQNDPSDPQSLSNNQPRAIFKDQSGGVWIGNEGEKINKVLERKDFDIYRNIPGDETTLSNNLIRSLYEDSEGLVWVGTQGGGLNLLDRNTGRARLFPLNDQLINQEISAIYQREDGKTWIGTWGGGLNIYDPYTNSLDTIIHEPGNPNSLPDNRVQVFHEDRFGVFWIGTENGLTSYDEASETWTPTSFDQLKSTIQGKAFKEEKDGTLWIGTWSGLNQVSPDRSEISSIGLQTEDSPGLTSDHVISLHLDDSNILWIGTFGGGLNRLDLQDMSLSAFTENDGLPNNVIFGILEDANDNLWLATNNGLSKFNKKTETFRNYDASEGIQSNEFYWGASHKNKDGSLMLGGVNGLNIFFPSDIKNNMVVATSSHQ